MSLPNCKVPDCDREFRARGYCGRHYQQARKAGEFQTVPRYTDAHDRLLRNTRIADDGCWEWTAEHTLNGYGITRHDGARVLAHRLSYETYIGAIPPGLQLDHLCRNRACVRPDHLEPVTGQVNTRRGTGPSGINAAKTHCKRNHEFTPENTRLVTTKYGHQGRACRSCSNADSRRYRQEAQSA